MCCSIRTTRGRTSCPAGSSFIAAVRAEAAGLARQGDLVEEWEDQSVLSMLACSLILLGRKSTRERDRMWFLRLAARAAEKYLSDTVPNSTTPTSTSTSTTTPARHPATHTVESIVEQPAESDWIAHLCEHLPAIRRRAEPAGLSSRLDEILTAAKLGKDMSGQYAELVRKLGGPLTGLRTGVPGLGGGQAIMGEVYVCEKGCPRRERREPGKPAPRCNVMAAHMPLRAW